MTGRAGVRKPQHRKHEGDRDSGALQVEDCASKHKSSGTTDRDGWPCPCQRAAGHASKGNLVDERSWPATSGIRALLGGVLMREDLDLSLIPESSCGDRHPAVGPDGFPALRRMIRPPCPLPPSPSPPAPCSEVVLFPCPVLTFASGSADRSHMICLQGAPSAADGYDMGVSGRVFFDARLPTEARSCAASSNCA